jgi:hypothetical protein
MTQAQLSEGTGGAPAPDRASLGHPGAPSAPVAPPTPCQCPDCRGGDGVIAYLHSGRRP